MTTSMMVMVNKTAMTYDDDDVESKLCCEVLPHTESSLVLSNRNEQCKCGCRFAESERSRASSVCRVCEKPCPCKRQETQRGNANTRIARPTCSRAVVRCLVVAAMCDAHAARCCATRHCAVRCCAVRCCAARCYVVLGDIVKYDTVLHDVVLCDAVLCDVVVYGAVMRDAVLCDAGSAMVRCSML